MIGQRTGLAGESASSRRLPPVGNQARAACARYKLIKRVHDDHHDHSCVQRVRSAKWTQKEESLFKIMPFDDQSFTYFFFELPLY